MPPKRKVAEKPETRSSKKKQSMNAANVEDPAAAAEQQDQQFTKEEIEKRYKLWMAIPAKDLSWWCQALNRVESNSKEETARMLATKSLIVPAMSEIDLTTSTSSKKDSGTREESDDKPFKRMLEKLESMEQRLTAFETKSTPTPQTQAMTQPPQPHIQPSLLPSSSSSSVVSATSSSALSLVPSASSPSSGNCQRCNTVLLPTASFCFGCGLQVLQLPDSGKKMSVEDVLKGGRFIEVAAAQLPDSKGRVEGRVEKRCTSFASWSTAFAKVLELAQASTPHQFHELFKYSAVIGRLAVKFDWEVVQDYDIMVRAEKATNPTLNLSELHGEAWALALARTTSQKPKGVKPGVNGDGRQRKDWKCADYNYRQCNYHPCKFLHKCIQCAGEHPAKDCSSNQSKSKGVKTIA